MGIKTYWTDRMGRTWAVFAPVINGGTHIFSGTGPVLRQISAPTAAVILGTSIAATFWPCWIGYITTCLSMLALTEFSLWALRRLFFRILGHELGGMAALALLYGTIAYTVKQGAGEGFSWRVLGFAGFCAGMIALSAVLWWALVRRRIVTAFTTVGAAISTAAVAALAVLLCGGGFQDTYVHSFLALASNQTATDMGDALQPSLSNGPYSVCTLDYGPEEPLNPGTVDLTDFMERDTDTFRGAYVNAYQNYKLDQVPLQGRIWYPSEATGCPVLFIAHGNHEITTPSYLGYTYLAAYLASHGYVVVSVDQNACNMLKNENDGRAVLLLEHVGAVLDFAQTQGNPLYGRIDAQNIALAGHSRGGEMAAAACLFNRLDHYPENGSITFDYHYAIRSVIAIAPTVDQYQPAGHSVEIQDVNYLLLHGAADRDVTQFMGMTQYENVSFSGEGDYLKSALYIAGANHGQFNSLWGAHDQRGPGTVFLNTNSLLSGPEQRQIAKIFIKVFLDVTLRGDNICRSLLTDWRAYADALPETVYTQCWATTDFTPLADFEEDADLSTGTWPGVVLEAKGTSRWTEEQLRFGGENGTHALRLRWNGNASYRVQLPSMDMTGCTLSFDICDWDTTRGEKADYRLVDADIRLTDTTGQTATARLSDFATVYPVQPVQTDKLDFLFATRAWKYAFSTVAIPVTAFTPNSGSFDWSAVTEIQFSFSGSGQIYMDHLGLYRQ